MACGRCAIVVAMAEPLLEIRDLVTEFRTDRGTVRAVDGVSFAVPRGTTLGVVGESGCGKSVTALSIMRLVASPPGRIGMIFQEPMTSLNPVFTVGDQVAEAVRLHQGKSRREARQVAIAMLAKVGIPAPEHRVDDYPHQLSGGMRQRVMIAMALSCKPDLLIADEPTTALDVTIQAQILELLRGLQAELGMSILLITHDLGVVARMAHPNGVMYAGDLVELASREAFFTQPRHPYTQALFEALPEISRRGLKLTTIPGQVPSLAAMPAGCRFADRCAHVMSVCREQSPPWREIADGHTVRCHWQGEAAEDTATRHAVTELDIDPGKPFLQVGDLKVHFPIRKGFLQRTVGHVRAVDGVSLAISAGRTLALVGESGCGKTTVGKALLQLIKPTAGSVTLGGSELVDLKGRRLRDARRHMQMIFQDPFASLNPRLRVGEIIAEGMGALGVETDSAARAAAVAALLQQVGLASEAIDRYPHEFSGGQRQRIAIARALAVQPELLICDEPTSALDVSVQAQILNLLKKLQADLGVAYLFITHNFAVVEYLAHDVAVMYLGRIVEQGRAEEVLRSPQHPYTKALLSAVPAPHLEARAEVIRLPGETPSPANPPTGCHFHPRCPQATDVCRQRYPAASAVSGTHTVSCHLVS